MATEVTDANTATTFQEPARHPSRKNRGGKPRREEDVYERGPPTDYTDVSQAPPDTAAAPRPRSGPHKPNPHRKESRKHTNRSPGRTNPSRKHHSNHQQSFADDDLSGSDSGCSRHSRGDQTEFEGQSQAWSRFTEVSESDLKTARKGRKDNYPEAPPRKARAGSGKERRYYQDLDGRSDAGRSSSYADLDGSAVDNERHKGTKQHYEERSGHTKRRGKSSGKGGTHDHGDVDSKMAFLGNWAVYFDELEGCLVIKQGKSTVMKKYDPKEGKYKRLTPKDVETVKNYRRTLRWFAYS